MQRYELQIEPVILTMLTGPTSAEYQVLETTTVTPPAVTNTLRHHLWAVNKHVKSKK